MNKLHSPPLNDSVPPPNPNLHLSDPVERRTRSDAACLQGGQILAQSELNVRQKRALVRELVKKSGLASRKSANEGFQLWSFEDVRRLGGLDCSVTGIVFVGVELQEGLVVD